MLPGWSVAFCSCGFGCPQSGGEGNIRKRSICSGGEGFAHQTAQRHGGADEGAPAGGGIKDGETVPHGVAHRVQAANGLQIAVQHLHVFIGGFAFIPKILMDTLLYLVNYRIQNKWSFAKSADKQEG